MPDEIPNGHRRMNMMLTRAPIGQTLSGRQGAQMVMPRKREISIVLAEVTTGSKDTMEQIGVWSLLWPTHVEIKDEL